MMDYLPPKKTIPGSYYVLAYNLCSSYVMLSERNFEGSCHLAVWLLHDNASMHKSVVVQQDVCNCEFLQLNHPEYSQDLGPSHYFLFRNLKFCLRGTRFTEAESVKIVV